MSVSLNRIQTSVSKLGGFLACIFSDLAGNLRQSSTTQSIKLGKYGHSDYLKARHGSLGQVRHAFEGGGCQESQELK